MKGCNRGLADEGGIGRRSPVVPLPMIGFDRFLQELTGLSRLSAAGGYGGKDIMFAARTTRQVKSPW
jgi:hypothetical protein